MHCVYSVITLVIYSLLMKASIKNAALLQHKLRFSVHQMS